MLLGARGIDNLVSKVLEGASKVGKGASNGLGVTRGRIEKHPYRSRVGARAAFLRARLKQTPAMQPLPQLMPAIRVEPPAQAVSSTVAPSLERSAEKLQHLDTSTVDTRLPQSGAKSQRSYEFSLEERLKQQEYSRRYTESEANQEKILERGMKRKAQAELKRASAPPKMYRTSQAQHDWQKAYYNAKTPAQTADDQAKSIERLLRVQSEGSTAKQGVEWRLAALAEKHLDKSLLDIDLSCNTPELDRKRYAQLTSESPVLSVAQ